MKKPGAMKTADVLRRNATSSGRSAGGGEYEVQESPEHCLVRLTFSAHPVYARQCDEAESSQTRGRH